MKSPVMYTIQSFGGGPPSCALLVLNITGHVLPKADLVVFADTGAEHPKTYKAVEFYRDYCKAHELRFEIVQSRFGSLEKAVLQNTPGRGATNIPIPIRTASGGQWPRHCTRAWKVVPIYNFLRQSFPEGTFRLQFAMTWDEIWRMKESKLPRVTNVYPLIDARMGRDASIALLSQAGLLLPVRSSCYFCPMKGVGGWARMRIEDPDLFERTANLEEAINRRLETRAGYDGQRVFLSGRLKPLRSAFPAGQQLLFGDDGYCETGFCFT